LKVLASRARRIDGISRRARPRATVDRSNVESKTRTKATRPRDGRGDDDDDDDDDDGDDWTQH